jgi:homoserine kinase type II
MNVARVLAHYDLGQFRGSRRIERGYVNEKWLVETSRGQYLLKRRHPSLREPGLIGAQHALVQHLHRVGFSTPAIVPTRRGTTFLRLQDEIYEVQDYVPGNPCDITLPAHFEAAARTLGRYHNAVQGFDHPALHRPEERYGPTALGQIIARLKKNWRGQTSPPLEALMGELEAHAQDLAARFEGFESLPQLVIHSDYYADNLILWGNVVAGVVDYDLAHWCWRVLEVAEALIYFAAKRPGTFKHIVYPGVLDLDAVRRFLTVYRQVVSLSGAEIDALPHMMRMIWLCASLHPPLKPLLSLQAAPQALPEILTLANWVQTHAPDIENLVFKKN